MIESIIEPLALTGGSVAVIGGAWWFKRWSRNVDESLREIITALRELYVKAAVAESQLKDIDAIREKGIINEQRSIAAHRRLDEKRTAT